VGEHLSKVFAKEFKFDFNNFIKANVDHLAGIQEVGPIVADCVVQFWKNSENRNVVNACFSAGVTLAEDIEILTNLHFDGRLFVFTGALKQLLALLLINHWIALFVVVVYQSVPQVRGRIELLNSGPGHGN